ncbi:MAG: TonB-dependent receptor [Pseudomonadota bacterium]|nr:TonB-dependent receptor [Pseudomonadota bacterium]
MYKKTVLAKSLLLAFGGTTAFFGASAFAQDTTQPQQLQRVEITGSAIKRIDAETSVPVTVIKIEDLKKEGVSTVEQVLSRLSASQSQQGTSQSVGLQTGGASFADMRGLGQNKTLILLDGRRIAPNTIDGSAPDLNMIPFAALERIEVLRDGASSLYGTDAIGGVINFITRRSLKGGTISVGYDSPQHPGGKAYNINAAGGVGDMDADGFNLLATFDYQKQDRISAAERPFGSTGFLPGHGIFKSSGSADPANYNQGGASDNPAGPACNSNAFIFNQSGNSCRYDYTKWVDLVPETERISGLLKGSLKLNADHQLNASYFYSQNTNSTLIAPVPFAALTMNPGTPFFPGNGSTPAPTAFTIDPTKPINIRWRDVPNGGRAQSDHNTQQRFVLSLEGNLSGWDYNTGVSYNENTYRGDLTGGYTDGTIITPGVQNGVINPFGAQSPAGTALLNSAAAIGTVLSGNSKTYAFDARASKELGDWTGSGKPAALAVGTEIRRETLYYAANTPFATLVVSSTGIDPSTLQTGGRNVYAVFSELNVPITKELDITGAVRYDKYSDFGSTINPKVSFRYQPSQQFLFRGSYSTGFRAPSLYELNNPLSYTNSANAWNDPVRCPGGTAIAGAATSDVCNTQFILLNGGNKNLQPEKSKSLNFGLVFEPMTDVSAGVDLWWIKLKNSINVLPDTLIFGDPVKNAGLFHRAPDGSLSIDGTQCPGANCGYITDTTSNLGGINTNGIDLTGAYRLRMGSAGDLRFNMNATYVIKYEYQQEVNGDWLQNVGIYSGSGPIFRWQHTINVDYTRGEWGAGIVNHFKSGYVDQNDPNQLSDPSFNNHVGAYTTWDLYGSWSPIKAISLTAGIRNVFDKEPPFSNQGATFQVGYDPRFTDPTGRAYYVRASYTF